MKFPLLSKYSALEHRIYTRNGGTSGGPFKSLNTSYTVGDSPKNVKHNLKLIKESIAAHNLLYMNQVHGKKVLSIAEKYTPERYPVRKADAVITDTPSLAVMVKQADCQGIILFDPVTTVVAVVHSGWKGSVENILGATANKMKEFFKCDPENIIAAIGPSLGPCCAEFKTHEEIFPSHFIKYMKEKDHFDFWSLSRMQLLNAGLSKENIEISGICTKCSTDLFFSYRGENITGRFATAAMIK